MRRAGASASLLDPGGLIQSVLEEYLPYYSERSVQMRELLLHERATDHAWWWLDDVQPALVLKGAGAEPSLLVNSSAPRSPGESWARRRSNRASGSCSRGCCSRHSPGPSCASSKPTSACAVWSSRSGPTHGQPATAAKISSSSATRRTAGARRRHLRAGLEPSGRRAGPGADRRADGSTIAKTRASRPAADFDEHLDDPKLTRRKLDWIERLAADQTRSLILQSSSSPSLLDTHFA